jgi:spermidine synthase
MHADLEELDYRPTPLGELVLRRRREPVLGIDVFEVKLGDEFLMSSLFTAGEVALARLGLAGLGEGPLDVVVGGLGLGHTARAVLDHPGVRSLLVIEALPAVIDWHRKGLVPLGNGLAGDGRCEFVNGDFFALVDSPALDSRDPGRRFDAILVDIDHTPSHVLHGSHASFYQREGLRRLTGHLRPGGSFALWSDEPPEDALLAELAEVFDAVQGHVVEFPNPLTGATASNGVYAARARGGAPR